MYVHVSGRGKNACEVLIPGGQDRCKGGGGGASAPPPPPKYTAVYMVMCSVTGT